MIGTCATAIVDSIWVKCEREREEDIKKRSDKEKKKIRKRREKENEKRRDKEMVLQKSKDREIYGRMYGNRELEIWNRDRYKKEFQ